MLLLCTRRERTAITLGLASIFVASITFASPFVRSEFARTAAAGSALRYSAPNELRVDDGVVTPAAGSITVNSTADVANSTDGFCTLREAITAANTDTASGATAGECAAGIGDDTIKFSVTGTITLTSVLPDTVSNISINGPGANLLTIQRSPAGGTPSFRIFNTTVFFYGVVTFSGLTIANGNPGSGSGGAILNGPGTVNVINCTLKDNVAASGGAILNTEGTVNITNSSLQHNVGASSGGGIFNEAPGTLNIINSILTDNSGNPGGSINGGNGGAIFNKATLNLTNSTLSNNVAAGGGGIYNGAGNTTVRLRNNIVALNMVSNSGPDLIGSFTTQGHNLIGKNDGSSGFTPGTNNQNGDLVGTNASPINPLLGSLANNGGPTQTQALLPGSPAIDAGDNCVTQAAHCGDASISQLTTDQRGPAFNRSVDGNGDGTATVDIGSYESSGSTNGKANQAIGFGPLANKTLGDPPFPVSANASSGLPVTLSVLSGPATISDNTVTITGAGTVTIRAAQAGDSNYNAAANVDQSFTVTRATTTSVTSSVNPSDFGQSVTFTATVNSSAGTPTGTVQFQDNGTNLGAAVALNASGVAQLIVSSLTAGTHTIRAEYSGDANFTSSTGTLSGVQVVRPALSINDVSITEGGGTKIMNFTVTLSAASNLTVKVDYATANGTATAASDYLSTSGALTYNPGDLTKAIGVTINGDQAFEPDETLFVNLSNPVNTTISKAQGLGMILNDDAQGGIISYSLPNYNVSESAGFVTITVNRSGDISFPATVDYATDDTGAPAACGGTSNGKASSRCDYTTAAGTLSFAAGDNAKTFQVLLSQDGYAEQPEAFTLNLSNLTGGAVLGAPSTATVTIANTAAGSGNPIDDAQNFVRQHYHDFLNREPDASGLAFWTNQITSCGADQACIEIRRINVSAAFFLSIEFQQTGYLVERLYKASYGDVTGTSTFGINPQPHQLPVPIIRLNEFLPDTQQIGQGVIVGQAGWEAILESNKQAFTLGFVQRARFTSMYPTSLTPAQFVDKLSDNAGVPKSGPEYNAAIDEFGGATRTSNTAARARALRRVAENSTFMQQEFNRAFVLIQYFGYLRRNPNDPQDTDYSGYDFWLTKLNQFNGNFVNADMVKGFITSGEYRNRFGP
jgi:CSLREA domain-containing protein